MNRKKRCKAHDKYISSDQGVKTPKGFFCSYESASQWGREQSEKKRKAAIAKDKKEFKKETIKIKKKFEDNDHPHQFKLTKEAAQKLANRLDMDLPCISCGKKRGSAVFSGGHYKTAGGHKEMALDIRNIHGQCLKSCNKEKSGNINGDKHSIGAKKGIIERYGQEMMDYLESYHPTIKRTCHELKEIRLEYLAEIKRIESGLGPSKNWREL